MRRFPNNLRREFKIFARLNTPAKVQDFLDRIPMNFETEGDTCRAPLGVLRHNEAHCLEGAMAAAAALWYHAEKPLLLDLKTTTREKDDPHVLAIFRRRTGWGAISKTNHAILRFRDPVYRSIRELAMSYFNEYFANNGAKTLRSYSAPFNLLRYGTKWLTALDGLDRVNDDLDRSPHFAVVKGNLILRRADAIEKMAFNFTEWPPPRKRK